jgi:hypothetical protein
VAVKPRKMTGLFFQEEVKRIRFWPHFDVYHRIGLKNFAFRMIRGLNLRSPEHQGFFCGLGYAVV